MADKVQVDPGLLNSEGRGVVNGIPYGEQLHAEKEAFEQQYALHPSSFKERLRAQTRKALGRG
jgi:hypothetical protein